MDCADKEMNVLMLKSSCAESTGSSMWMSTSVEIRLPPHVDHSVIWDKFYRHRKMDLAQTLADLGKNVKIISEMIASDSTLRSAAQDNPVLCFWDEIARFVIDFQKLE